MQDTGFKLGQYVINNVGWTNVNNILSADGSYAASTPVSGQASEFTVGGFLLNVPAGALISGFELEFTGYRGIDTLPGTTLEVWAYDNTNENNAYYQMLPVFTGFGTSVGTFVIGSPTYSFNTVLDSTQANNLKFKIVVNGEVYLDSVQVRCFYQPAVENIIITPETCSPLLQAQPFYLEIPIGSSDTTCIVNQFVTISGLPITNVDIPNGYPAVLDQGKSNEENIVITNVEYLSGDRRQLTISRGWTDRDPVGQETFLRKPHGAGAELTLSNNIEFYDLFLRKCHIGSLVSAPITVKDESTPIATYLRDLNFVGSGVQATAVSHVGSGGGQDVTVTISGNNTVPPTVNGSSSGTSGNNLVNTLTYNTHAITGTNRATLVSVSMSSGAALSTVTLGGNAMTFLGANNNGGVRVEDWVLVNPPLGTQAIVITVAASATSYISSTQTTWNGADQTTPFVIGTTNDGSDNDSEGTATTTVNNSIIVHTLATAAPSITYTAGSGENLVATSLSGQVQSGIQTQDVGTPSVQTSTINLSQNTTWANILVKLAPIAVDSSDEKVKVSINDTVASYLSSKIVAGANITITVLNPGGNEQLQIAGLGAGGGTSLATGAITQTGHGFTVAYPTPVRKTDTGDYVKSQAIRTTSSDLSAEVIGIAVASDANTFVLYYGGLIPTTTAPFSALDMGTPLFVSEATAGILTDVEPTGTNEVSKPVAYVNIETGGSASIVMYNYRGLSADTTIGTTKNGVATKTGTTQTINHALGAIPNTIDVHTAGAVSHTDGFYDASGQHSIGTRQGGGSASSNTSAFLVLDNASGSETGIISNVTSTDFDITWSGTSLPAVVLWKVSKIN